MRLQDRVALITGAANGIGKETSLLFASEGARVVLIDVDESAAVKVVEEIDQSGGEAIFCHGDVSSAEDCQKMVKTCEDHFGRLDVLFNNAGIGAGAPSLEQITPEQWQSVVDINLTGTFLCTREAMLIMKDQTPMGGRIINNGSISAYVPRPGSAPYSATKHGVTGLTRSTALDGRKYDIACSQIDIGNAATPMTARMSGGVPQANGEVVPEPTFDVNYVGEQVLFIANLPLDTNIQFMTIMATKMPYVGRG